RCVGRGRTLARARVERRLLRELADLLRDAEPIAARMRTVCDPAVPPMRCAGRALPRSPGALLSPRLLIAARDFAAGQRIARTLTLIRQERDDRAMQHVLVHRAVEQRLGE